MRTPALPFVLLLLLNIAILLLTIPGARCGSDIRLLEKRILDNLTKNENYDTRIRPNGIVDPDGPVIVRANMFVRSLSKINEADMDYSVQLTFRQEWSDPRLQYDDYGGKLRYLTLRDHDSIWKPDLFFSNEKEGHMHNLIQPNYLMRIFPGGSVLYSVRLSLVLSCPMDLKNFPLDRQTCPMIMASYGYTTEDVVFLWKEGDPVQVTRNLHLLDFTLNNFMTDYCTSRTNTGEYSCLKLNLSFERNFSYYLYQTYIPFGILVVLSWITFWIDKKKVAVRFSLAVVAMLAIAILTKGVNTPLPKTSYMKAIDVWTATCQLFVLGVLLEFGVVSYLLRKSRRQNVEQKNTDMEHNMVEVKVTTNGDALKESQKSGKWNWRVWITKLTTGSERIDVISRILFPLAFVIFNLVYWNTYPSNSEY